MPRIAIIGAGGFVFPLTLIRDILSFPELRGATLALMDIDTGRLQQTMHSAQQLVAQYGLPTEIIATTDRRTALRGASYVIVAFQVGGLEAYRLDVAIPRRYGIDQTVGDTLGPGGIMRGLRTIPVLLDIARDMQEICPDALLIQYANPTAMNCWALHSTGIKTVGLCHSVQNTSRMLARQIAVSYGEVRFKAAGIIINPGFSNSATVKKTFTHGCAPLCSRSTCKRMSALIWQLTLTIAKVNTKIRFMRVAVSVFAP